MTAQEDLTGMPTPKQDERTPGPCKALKDRRELFSLGEDETGGPCFFWTNPWSGTQEKIANLWWPTHPVEATAEVEALFADLSLHTEADDEATYELGKRDGYEDAVQTIDVETGGDGEFYGSTIPGRGVDVPTMQAGIIERFETLKHAYGSTDALRSALVEARRMCWTAVRLGIDDPAFDPDKHALIQQIDAALSGTSRSLGYLYFNPDTGTEFSENHPIESGECNDAENIREATAEALRDELLDAWREREDAEVELARKMEPVKMSTLTEDQIKHMVDRFLMWSLPEGFNPDGGITFEKIAGASGPHPFTREPVGTNLFTADQATEMVRHMFEGLRQPASEEEKLNVET